MTSRIFHWDLRGLSFSSSCRVVAKWASSSSSPSPRGSSSTRNRPSNRTSSAYGFWNAKCCSGALMAFFLVFDRADFGMKTIVRSVAPTIMGMWWYVTAYATFLALLPFLSKGLRALGEHMHYALAITVLAIWGLTSFIPGTSGVNDSVFGFIYLFILISAYKWYMKPFTLKQTWLMTGIGLGFFLLYTCASVMLSLFGIDKGIFIAGSFKLPVIMVGFDMFLLFDRLSFRSRIINRIARSAFAVYLITDYPATRTLLWKHLFVLENLYQQPFAILQILGILLTIYLVSAL